MISESQSQEQEHGDTWRRHQLHLEGPDGSQEVPNDSKNWEKRGKTWQTEEWGPQRQLILEGELGAVVLTNLCRAGRWWHQQMRGRMGVAQPPGAAQPSPGSRASLGGRGPQHPLPWHGCHLLAMESLRWKKLSVCKILTQMWPPHTQIP